MAHLENLGYVCHVLTVAALFISYVTPYWAVYHDYVTGPIHKGLLANCEEDTCTIFKDERIVREIPGQASVHTNITSLSSYIFSGPQGSWIVFVYI